MLKFQAMMFMEGIMLNTQTSDLGVVNLSLFRYIVNKKDLSESKNLFY